MDRLRKQISSFSPAGVTSFYVLVCYIWHWISGVFFAHFFAHGFPWFVNSERFLILTAGTTILLYILCRRLWGTKELMESFFNHTTDALSVFDTSMRIVMVNPAFESLFGYTQAELAGHLLPITPAAELEDIRTKFHEVVQGKVPFVEYEGKKICKNGQTLNVLVRLSPIRNARGKIVSISAVSKDMTELRNTQQMLINYEKLRAVGQLAAGIAHEIRNPLTSVMGFLQLMENTVPDSQQKYFSVMQNELARIESITNEMLALAKPQAMQYRPINLPDVLMDTVNLLSAQAHMNNIEIEIQFDSNEAPVLAEFNRLKQVFVNVIKNGMESMNGGGVLQIRMHQTGELVIVSFSDHGSGIPEEIMNKIGDPFFTTKEDGTGLGLLVSQNIIRDHSGTMDITSEYGKGTTVTISFPLYPHKFKEAAASAENNLSQK
ncbi:ATP-binding protein [Alicyclobacillus suci]|uniref:ATP-binding protein n=1 Tax=Alicyclobacillus suci TaxID=2816080 RepID=UPI001A8FFC25|nr:ATP-binding protein [Alicyclobacillus suci]